MRSQKKARFFSLGRKWVFTLALFLFVFAAASVVKVHAIGNVTGWLWGGSEDKNLGGNYDVWPPDGNETGVGEIRMSGTIQDGSGKKYGVNIPNSGNLSGEAWSENLGYLSFNVADLVGCPNSDCRAWRDGNTLKGWARFMEFKINAAQAGGWGGWVSLSNLSPGAGKLPYGVVIEGDSFKKCNGKTGENCAWSGETPGTGGNIADGLGWIDFSQAKVEEVCTLAFDSASKTLNEDSSGSAILSEVGTSCKCKNVKIESTNTSVADGVSPTIANFFADIKPDSAKISFNTKSVGSSTYFPGIIKATSDDCGEASLNLLVQNIPSCTVSCPSSVEVPIGQSISYDVSITGDSDCALDRCQSAGSGSITSAKDGTTKCRVTVDSTGKIGDKAISTAYSNGTGNCPTNVFVKRLGWIETNP